MAKKKKQEDAPAGSPAWMATFSDLMNLLLCFFVLLFSMSNVDPAKFNKLADALSSSFSIFKDSGSSIFTEGQLINLGTAQLNELDDLINNMGEKSEETGEDIRDLVEENIEYIEQNVEFFEEISEVVNEVLSEKMYDEISELVSEYNLDEEYVTYSMDENGSRYISLNVNGAILFDSGSAEIKSDYMPVVSKIGDILKQFDGHRIEIIGHTDNVPVRSGRYADNMELSSARAASVARYLRDKKQIQPEMLSWSGRADYDSVDTNSTEEGRRNNRRIEIKIYNLKES